MLLWEEGIPTQRDLMMEFQWETAEKLAAVYRRLREHFDYVHPWWPGTPFQIAITAVLVQQCDWGVAWEAVHRLPGAGVKNLVDLADAKPAHVQSALQKVTFAPTKSERLVAMARRIHEWGFESFEAFLAPDRGRTTVRDAALRLAGVGQETADCWLNFASGHASFVVDSYTRRIFGRLNFTPKFSADFWRRGPYTAIQEFFETHLSQSLELYDEFDFPEELPRAVALYRDYHALLVELGKHHCLKTKPLCFHRGNPGWPNYEYCRSHCLPGKCSGCPLSATCRFPVI